MFSKTQIVDAFSQMMFGMLGAVIVQLIFIHHAPKIVIVNITGIIKSFENEVLKQKLPNEDLSRQIKKFGQALNSSTASYSESHNYVLVPKEVVISGAEDKTDEVKALIKTRLNT